MLPLHAHELADLPSTSAYGWTLLTCVLSYVCMWPSMRFCLHVAVLLQVMTVIAYCFVA